ncbi:MAG TPA: hypothetical protein VIH57_08950 [Bacteroidales bacterium]
MKKILLLNLLPFICCLAMKAQAVYVDSNTGNDNSPGTKEAPVFSMNKAAEIISKKDNNLYVIKINPGIYILNKHISVATQKPVTSNKRIVIEAGILPDDSTWTPEKMPIILTTSKKGEIMEKDLFIKDNWITGFYINESHVTIRGIKFLGYNYPVNFYYPIVRFNKEKTDLLVEQCMFLGDQQTSVIQVGIIAHGDSVKVDHCIFYKTNNAVVFWQNSGNGIKTGNSMTNCIVYGSAVSSVWTASPDKDFIYKNNVVTHCNFAWIKEAFAGGKYAIDNCVIVNNQHYLGDSNLNPLDETMNETNVIKEGDVSLRMIDTILKPWPIDHLHVIPDSPGYNIGAGLFKYRKL